MITILFVLTFLTIIALPIVLAHQINKRYDTGWGLFGIGAVTFVASQVLHIPFNLVVQNMDWFPKDTAVFSNLLIVALFLGASAGFFEEGARYLTYRFWAKKARTWKQGMMMGAGHGGIEAILLVGLAGLVNALIFAVWQNGGVQDIVPPEQADLFQSQVDAFFATPWYIVPMALAERVFAICFHLAASLLVMQVFVRKQIRYWFAAFGLHTALNATAVILSQLTTERFGQNGVLIVEAALGIFALFAVWIILKLKNNQIVEEEDALPQIAPVSLANTEISKDSLENSKFS